MPHPDDTPPGTPPGPAPHPDLALAGGPGGPAALRPLLDTVLAALTAGTAARRGPLRPGGPRHSAERLRAAVPPGLPATGTGAEEALRTLVRAVTEGAADPADPHCVAHLHCPPLALAVAADLAASRPQPLPRLLGPGPRRHRPWRPTPPRPSPPSSTPTCPQPDALVTTGGTESNQLALLLARERARAAGAPGIQIVCGAQHPPQRAPRRLAARPPRTRRPAHPGRHPRPRRRATPRSAPCTDPPSSSPPPAPPTPAPIDPLPAIAEVAAAHGAELHVDAAYGGPLLFSRHRAAPARRPAIRRLRHPRPAQTRLATGRRRTARRPRHHRTAPAGPPGRLPQRRRRHRSRPARSARPLAAHHPPPRRPQDRRHPARPRPRRTRPHSSTHVCDQAGRLADRVERHPGLTLHAPPHHQHRAVPPARRRRRPGRRRPPRPADRRHRRPRPRPRRRPPLAQGHPAQPRTPDRGPRRPPRPRAPAPSAPPAEGTVPAMTTSHVPPYDPAARPSTCSASASARSTSRLAALADADPRPARPPSTTSGPPSTGTPACSSTAPPSRCPSSPTWSPSSTPPAPGPSSTTSRARERLFPFYFAERFHMPARRVRRLLPLGRRHPCPASTSATRSTPSAGTPNATCSRSTSPNSTPHGEAEALGRTHARNLVLGVGTAPHVPEPLRPLVDAPDRPGRSTPPTTSTTATGCSPPTTSPSIGSGQSGAEVFLDLLRARPAATGRRSLARPHRGLRPHGVQQTRPGTLHPRLHPLLPRTSPNRYATGSLPQQWQLHKGIDRETIAAIHDELYRRTLRRRLAGRRPHPRRHRPHRRPRRHHPRRTPPRTPPAGHPHPPHHRRRRPRHRLPRTPPRPAPRPPRPLPAPRRRRTPADRRPPPAGHSTPPSPAASTSRTPNATPTASAPPTSDSPPGAPPSSSTPSPATTPYPLPRRTAFTTFGLEPAPETHRRRRHPVPAQGGPPEAQRPAIRPDDRPANSPAATVGT